MKRLFLLALGACSLFGGIVFAVDPIQDNSPHDLGDYSCDVTSSVLYYAGTTNIYPADIFDGSTNLHWRISVVPNDSWYSIYNNGLFNAPGFQFGSNGKPINQGPVIAVSPLSPASIQTSIPTGYTRSQIASQIVYHLKRWAYTAGPFPNPIYYTPVGGSTQYTTINSSPNASTTQEDDECRNMYIGFCGDGVVDNGSQTTFEGTPAQFASYSLAGNEDCDDGNTDPFDDCVTYDMGTPVCVLPYCGDGYIQPGEDCDDGNNVNGDGCPSNCQFAPLTGECGSANGLYHYDFNNSGDLLTATSPGLCDEGSVTNFVYNAIDHEWSWSCSGANGGGNATCLAYETRCGNGNIDIGTNEVCDGSGQAQCSTNGICSGCICVYNVGQGTCGAIDGTSIYDFNNSGDALTATSPGLCADGMVIDFVYNATIHKWTWDCVEGGFADHCRVQELWCGNNIVETTGGANEDCDGSIGCSSGSTCTNQCECIQDPIDGVCGSVDDTTIYDFDNNGNALTATSPGLCADGNVSLFLYNTQTHTRSRQCVGLYEGDTAFCGAQELRCGNGDVETTMGATEECDGIGQAQCDDNYICQQCDCSYQPNCGNGVTDPGEECDDGNTNNSDECTNSCEFTYCGDGITQNPNGEGANERCDDGNNLDTDLCTTMCMETYCGDGITQNPNASGQEEECDDGNGVDTDGCSNTCQSNPLCGNGVLDTGEECDDGNNTNGDGCSSSCEEEYCGDGYRDTNGPDNITGNVDDEACEQDAHCPVAGSDCTASCDCVPPVLTYCGDGVVQSPNSSGQYEECDDGNTIDTDACRNNCTLPGGGASSCDSLTVTSTTQNVPTQIGYQCLGQGSAVLVELFGSTGTLLATSTTAVGSFSVTTPDTYTIVCSYDGITSQVCQRTLDLGRYCKDLVATSTTGNTYTFACSGIGDNYQIVITDSQNHVVTTATATGDFTYTYTFTSPGTYTAICFVDDVSNMTCTDGTGFTTQAYSTAFGGNTVGVMRTSLTTRLVSAPNVDYRTNGFISIDSLSSTLSDYALGKWMKGYVRTIDPTTITVVSKPNISVVKTDFEKKIDDITTSVTKQLDANCYNACLETIVIGGGSTGSCLLTTDPTTTSVEASSLTVTGTCAFSGLTGTSSLACGNGTVLTGTSGVCLYTGYSIWTMQCLLDNKSYPGCEKPIHTYKGGGGGGGGGGSSITCGNGKIDAGEQCDEGSANGVGSICSSSCTLKGVNPGTSDGIKPPKCAFVDPPSIQLGEILPFWRDTEESNVSSTCNAGSVGKVSREGLFCHFTVTPPRGKSYTYKEPCTTDKLTKVGRYNDLQIYLQENGGMLKPQRGQSYIDTSSWATQVYGEYTITLDKITYDICTKQDATTSGGAASYTTVKNNTYAPTTRICQFNFAVTTPYLIQKGTSLSSFADDKKKLSNFLTIDGETILQLTNINLLDKTSTTTAFDNLKETLSKEAKKAVSSVNFVNPIGKMSSSFKKVPNQELYVIDESFTINEGNNLKQFNGGRPTTLLVQGDVTVDIIGSLPGNLLLLVPEGRVRFINADCDATDTISATIVAAHVETSFAVTNANRSVDNKERCTDGKLVIKGVLITKNSSDIVSVRDARRSTLHNRFDGKQAKAEHIYAGASLRVESRPEKRTEQPPLATKNSLFFTTQSHGSAGDQLPLPLPILESLLVLFEEF